MTSNIKVIKSKDCGNSPRNKSLEDFTISVAKGKYGPLKSLISEETEWTISGGKLLKGQKEIFEDFILIDPSELCEFRILQVMSHGRSGAVTGVATRKTGTLVHFCHVFEFTSASGKMIKKISTFTMN